MSLIRLPQKYLSQPQGMVQLAPQYSDALFFTMSRSLGDTDIARNNGITSNGGITPTEAVRPWGKTLSYNGSGNNLKTASGLGAPTAFTVLAWVRPAATGLSYPRICETDYSVGFYLGGSSTSVYEWITAADLSTCMGGTIVAGQRDFIVGTFASNLRSLYVNGVLVDTATSGGINSSYGHLPLVIGANAGNTNSNSWNGDIDTVGVFPRAFSAEEVKELYNSPWSLLRQPTRDLFVIPSAGGSNSYTISPTGSISIAGSSGLVKTKIFLPSGKVSFNGSNALTKTKIMTPSGEVVLSGAANIVKGRVLSPSGGLFFSGSTLPTKTKIIAPSGSIAFSGTSSLSGAMSYQINPTGNVYLLGSAKMIKTKTLAPKGKVTFGGTAPMTSNTVIQVASSRIPMTGAGQ